MKKILVVEDNPDLVFLLTSVLESLGYTVVSATHGSEGVEKAAKEKPLAATVLNRRSELQTCIEAGCNDWLVKPFSRQDLQGKIQAFIPTPSPTFH